MEYLFGSAILLTILVLLWLFTMNKPYHKKVWGVIGVILVFTLINGDRAIGKTIAGMILLAGGFLFLYAAYEKDGREICYALKNITNIFVITSFIPLLMLIVAAFVDMPYNYYIFLRWVVFICWFFQAYNSFFFILPGIVILIVFNPILPWHLSENAWVVCDIFAAGFFLMGLLNFDSRTM